MARAILYGGVVVGTLDLLDALIFFGLRGTAPIRIFQSIAAGVLGRASYQGGLRSAALGIALPPAAWAAVFVVVNLAIALPSTPGYVGAIEAAAVFALTALGVEAEQALAAALLYHAVHFVPTTVLGALALRLRPEVCVEAA